MSVRQLRGYFALALTCVLTAALFAQDQSNNAKNKALGEVELQGAGKVEKTSGVWVDGQYLGYLKELKGDKKILLLPGQHEIVVRQDGYVDFRQAVILQPREKEVIAVKMNRDLSFRMPSVFSEIKLAVNPNRAASLWMACSWVM